MPQNKSTKFMDSVIFTLYNYASNQREEYLLLRLFKTALQEEIKYGQGGQGLTSPEMPLVQTQTVGQGGPLPSPEIPIVRTQTVRQGRQGAPSITGDARSSDSD